MTKTIKLINGLSYAYGSIVFEHQKEVQVSDEIAEELLKEGEEYVSGRFINWRPRFEEVKVEAVVTETASDKGKGRPKKTQEDGPPVENTEPSPQG